MKDTSPDSGVNIFDKLIEVYSAIPDSMWITRLGKYGGPRCAIGHITDVHLWSEVLSAGEEVALIDVNDGANPKYQQSSIKERVIQYCKDKRDGK
jgi:hypothetical protein